MHCIYGEVQLQVAPASDRIILINPHVSPADGHGGKNGVGDRLGDTITTATKFSLNKKKKKT